MTILAGGWSLIEKKPQGGLRLWRWFVFSNDLVLKEFSWVEDTFGIEFVFDALVE